MPGRVYSMGKWDMCQPQLKPSALSVSSTTLVYRDYIHISMQLARGKVLNGVLLY